MLSQKIRNIAQYFDDRSATILILGPLAAASVAHILADLANQAAALEAEVGKDLPPDIIDLAAVLHKSGVRRGVMANPKSGGAA